MRAERAAAMRIEILFSLIVCGAVFALYLKMVWMVVRGQWRAFRTRHPDKTINFSIVDFWTVLLGLTPSFLLIGEVPSLARSEGLIIYLLVIHLAVCQAAGMAWGKLEMHTLLNEIVLPQWKSSVGITFGALIGGIIGIFSAFTAPLWIVPALMAMRHHSAAQRALETGNKR